MDMELRGNGSPAQVATSYLAEHDPNEAPGLTQCFLHVVFMLRGFVA